MTARPSPAPDDFTVLHAKFTTYLPWSQPFLHDFLTSLAGHITNVVMCTRTENLDRFPLAHVVEVPTPQLLHPSLGIMTAAYLQRVWRPRVIHAQFGFSGIHSLLLKQLLGIPLITTFGGRDASAQIHMPYLDELLGLVLGASDRIVAVSRELRDQLVSAGASPGAIEVIRRGTKLEKFGFIDRGGREGAGPVQLLMVGRVVEKKGHRYALEAVSRLRREGLDVRLTIAGDGPLMGAIRQMRGSLGLDQAVDLIGAVQQTQVRQHLARADVLLHCSVTAADGDREGIPNALVEAAATGLPAIGSRHGGIVEVIHDGRTGVLVAERDVDALTAAIRSFARSAPLRLSMGQAAASLARAEFDLERQAERHVALYRELARQAPARPSAWFPGDFATRLVDTLRDRRNAGEYSMLTLIELLARGRRFRFRSPALHARPGKGLVNDLQRHSGRFSPGLKSAIRSNLARLIGLRDRLGLGPRHLVVLDRMVLDYIGQGGRLSDIDETWDLAALEKHLRRTPKVVCPA